MYWLKNSVDIDTFFLIFLLFVICFWKPFQVDLLCFLTQTGMSLRYFLTETWLNVCGVFLGAPGLISLVFWGSPLLQATSDTTPRAEVHWAFKMSSTDKRTFSNARASGGYRRLGGGAMINKNSTDFGISWKT